MMLTILTWTLIAALVAMLLAPRSRNGKAARETLVDAPARFLLDMTWAKTGRMALLAPVFIVLALAGPEMLAMLVMMGGDLAAVELLLVLWAASISGGLSAAWRRIAAGGMRAMRFARRVSRFPARRRSLRSRRRKGIRKLGKDGDEPGWAYA